MSAASTSRRLTVLAALAPVAFHAHAQQAGTARPVPQVEIKGAAASYDARRDDTAMKTSF